MSTSDQDTNNNLNSSQEPREELIKTAVKFLQNPHVAKSPLAKSQQFLRSKGLTDQEIQLACERSGAYGVHYFNEKPPSLPPAVPMQQLYLPPPQSMFIKVRDTLQSAAIFGGLVYLVYQFYKKYIRPWLFGDKKKKSIEDSISDLNKSMTESINDLRDNLTEVRTQVDRIKNLQADSPTTHMQLQDLKNEVSSVKGLLLSRKQFPSVSSNPLVPPSIPAWQLSSVPPDQDGDGKVEELMEIGSGSGSSETEVVTKNSDSSLEIM